MRAIQIDHTGGPEVLVLRDVPDPQPGPGEALIRIEASGVNFIDTYVREGRYPAKLPFILGQEAAGTIVSLGPPAANTPEFKIGDRVVWCSVPGTYAEMAVAPLDRLVRIPEGVSAQQAAAAMLQGMTAHYLAYSTYRIQSGDSVLIHAGAGGVGLLLIQMAKRLGARVFTTVSTDEKASRARGAGADETILYTHENFTERVRELTGGNGLPVVYDSQQRVQVGVEKLLPRIERIDSSRNQHARDRLRAAEPSHERQHLRRIAVPAQHPSGRFGFYGLLLHALLDRNRYSSSLSSTTIPPMSVTDSISSWNRSYHSVDVSNRNITPWQAKPSCK